MRLDYHIPSAALREQVTVIAACGGVTVATVETLPAMLPNLHIRLAGESAYRMADGSLRPAPRVALIGPTSQAYQAHLEPGVELLTAGLLPRGWHGLVGVPAEELGDRVLDGGLLWGEAEVERLCAQLAESADTAGRLQVLEAFLLRRQSSRRTLRAHALEIIDHWLERDPLLSLDVLSGELGLCQRQMRRLSLELHGLSPKALAMKYRALRAAASLAVHGWQGMHRLSAGYADQAHLTRDFRRFVGWTPVAFARERQNIAAATFAGRRRAGAVRALSLLS